ncbi:hypothetical protein [Spirosoma endbachense]|uniref:LPXTG cell wall anchor domain-containing protein n=1 Tax=Spirosoma endbachense TaxID=2666025 RepID=A0A6P1VR90_9BACT|nr:hypothetical protein [Spirosoma endbachense]QHV94237.1 hypothetical protein GJR95_03985 [Spirosoma endbachense]
MENSVFSLVLPRIHSRLLADVISTQPTGSPTVDYLLIVGVFAVAILLIVRRVRKRKQP